MNQIQKITIEKLVELWMNENQAGEVSIDYKEDKLTFRYIGRKEEAHRLSTFLKGIINTADAGLDKIRSEEITKPG